MVHYSLAAIENHHCAIKPDCSYTLNEHVSCLRRCDERTHVTMSVNKSLFQALKSSAVVLSVMSFICGNSKSAGLANAHMDSQKLDAILREPSGEP